MNKTTVEALKELYTELGGTASDVADLTTDAEMIEAVKNIAGTTIELPAVSSTDNGDFLRVVDGAWAKATVPEAESEAY